MNTTPPCCTNCRFWHPVIDEDEPARAPQHGYQLGHCRRFPPSYEGWAMTHAPDWCGEYQPPAAHT